MSADITNIMWVNNNAPGQAAVYGPNWTGYVDTADGTATIVQLQRSAFSSAWVATSSRDWEKVGHGRTRTDAVQALLVALDGEA